VPQEGKHEGSPGVGGSVCSRAQRQVDLATESLTDTVGYYLVPMYQMIGLSVAVALLILLLMGILRDAGHRDLGNCNGERKKLRMVADSQGAHCWQGSHLSDVY